MIAISSRTVLTLSSDIMLLLVGMDSALMQHCFGARTHYPSIQPGWKTCTHVLMTMHTHRILHAFPSLALCLIHIHAYTHGQAAMGGGNARNAPNPGLVFWLVPDFMPSPPGSVARPPCARPTGSNTRPGQPSCSSRPIINQQAALQRTSPPPPPPHSTAGAPWKLRRRIYSPVLQLVDEDAVEDTGGGSFEAVYTACVNTLNHLLPSAMNSLFAIEREWCSMHNYSQ